MVGLFRKLFECQAKPQRGCWPSRAVGSPTFDSGMPTPIETFFLSSSIVLSTVDSRHVYCSIEFYIVVGFGIVRDRCPPVIQGKSKAPPKKHPQRLHHQSKVHHISRIQF